MTSKPNKTIDRIRSGTLNREQLNQLRINAETLTAKGDLDAQAVLQELDGASPSDQYILFMGFCPDANFDNRVDREWKERGVCTFDWEESQRQIEQFSPIMPGDLIILKKREKFGETMKLFGYGRVATADTDNDGFTYYHMDWADQESIIEVPLMGCNSTVNIRNIDQVRRELPTEFWDWLKAPPQS